MDRISDERLEELASHFEVRTGMWSGQLVSALRELQERRKGDSAPRLTEHEAEGLEHFRNIAGRLSDQEVAGGIYEWMERDRKLRNRKLSAKDVVRHMTGRAHPEREEVSSEDAVRSGGKWIGGSESPYVDCTAAEREETAEQEWGAIESASLKDDAEFLGECDLEPDPAPETPLWFDGAPVDRSRLSGWILLMASHIEAGEYSSANEKGQRFVEWFGRNSDWCNAPIFDKQPDRAPAAQHDAVLDGVVEVLGELVTAVQGEECLTREGQEAGEEAFRALDALKKLRARAGEATS